METTTTTVEITEFGTTRTVEILPLGSSDWTAAHGATTSYGVVVATIGRGVARYPDALRLFKLEEGQTAHRGNRTVTAANGLRFQYHLGTCIRNRQARIVGWADVAGITNHIDQART